MQISFVVLLIAFLGAKNFVVAAPTFDKIAEVLVDMIDPPAYRPRPPPERYNYPSRPIYPSAPYYPPRQPYPAGQQYPAGYQQPAGSYYPPGQNYPGYDNGYNYGGYYQQPPIAHGNSAPYPNNYYGTPNYDNRPGYRTHGY